MTELTKAPWPDKQARTVYKHAMERSHQEALDTLAMIRNELFGDADRAEELATWWGENPAMTNSKAEIEASRENLAAYWQGGGYDSYNTYAINTSGRFATNEGVLNDVAGSMQGCVGIVYDTYKDAIDFISSCAHDLVNAELSIVEAAILGPLGLLKAATEIMGLLNDFVKNVADLVAKAVAKMGELREQGIFLSRQANDFMTVPDTAAPIEDPDMWAVKPKPDN
jgi:hypothetical protein